MAVAATSDTFSFRAAARRWWWVVLVAACLAGAAGYFSMSREEPVYEARARLLVGPVAATVGALETATKLGVTYTQLVTSEAILRETSAELGQPGMLWGPTHVYLNRARILTIAVESRNPAAAAEIANALAANLIEVVQRSTASQRQALQVIEPAQPPPRPKPVSTTGRVVAAAVAGLLGALAFALVGEALGARMRRAAGERGASAAVAAWLQLKSASSTADSELPPKN